ncbi:MAG: hypothetical protein GX181_08660 [Synergistaceae bacterium]|nr:hypothetical protein [Synergistota bacterium]NLM72010.1 hypothetical protein [Synergistaceae bacterium]
MAAGSSRKIWLVLASLIIGTVVGLYLQRFALTEPFFRDILSTGFDLRDVNLAFAEFGLRLSIRWNAGTVAGGVIGIWLAR